MRIDSNDYSIHPAVIGRRIELVVDLRRVRALCDGRLVADHERAWAWHQTISDPDHLAAARALRRDRVGVLRPVTEPEVEQRDLTDYDAALGLAVDVVARLAAAQAGAFGLPPAAGEAARSRRCARTRRA